MQHASVSLETKVKPPKKCILHWVAMSHVVLPTHINDEGIKK